MNLGEYINAYCSEHNLSVRQFAAKCGLSHTYISLLVNGKPKTGKRPSPTLEAYGKIASAVGLTLDELLSSVQEDYVTLNPSAEAEQPRPKPELSESEEQLIQLFRSFPESEQRMLLDMIRAALTSKGLL